MAIGERIRFIRNLRGMTQKWLGQAVGFPEKTADVRMAQYESGSRTPKEDLVKALANVLEVSPLALSIPDIDSNLGFIHTLFAVEDLHGVRVEQSDNEVHIVFDGSMTVGVIHSRQRTPHSVGRKFPHRNSVICLWKLSKRIRTNHPLTHIAIFKGKRLLKSGKLSIWQLTKVPNWHFATTTISSPTASSQIGNLRYKKMSLYIPSLLSCFYPLLADKVQ